MHSLFELHISRTRPRQAVPSLEFLLASSPGITPWLQAGSVQDAQGIWVMQSLYHVAQEG